MKKEVATLESQENETSQKRNALLESRRMLTADIDRYSLELETFRPIAKKSEIEKLLESVQNPQIKIRQTYIEEINKADRCQSCHVGIDQPARSNGRLRLTVSGTNKQPFAKHPGDFIYLTNHPTDKFGCTLCHHGQGRATSSAEKAHGNVEFWTQPMLKGEFAQATCQKCHSNVKNLRGAPALSKGEELIEKHTCYGCHKIAGYENMPKTGPPLSNIGEKISYSWLAKWLDEPRGILPEARMPDYGFSDEEAASVADYLFSLSVDEKSDDLAEEEVDYELADKGKIVYRVARCSICHVANELGGAFKKVYAPDLSIVGSKLRKNWLIDWIKNPQAYYSDTSMPQYRFTDGQAETLSEYIKNEFIDWDLEDTKLEAPQPIKMASIEKGAQLIKNYGCFGCHDIKGTEELKKIGPYLRRSEMEENVAAELSSIGSKPMERLDFGKLEGELEETREAFLFTKLKTPRVFSDNLMMPNYKFPDDEVTPLATLLIGFTPEEIENMPLEFRVQSKPSDYEPTGEFAQIADELRCLVCHAIKGKGSDFGPDLTIEGSMVKREWLKKFLEKPDIIRPLLKQMPKLQISPQPRMFRGQLSPSEVEIIVRYIEATLTTAEIPEGFLYGQTITSDEIASGRELYYKKACNVCHQIGKEGGAIGPELTKVEDRLKPGYIFMHLKNPQTLIPDIIMPNYNLSDEETTLLVKFLMNLK